MQVLSTAMYIYHAIQTVMETIIRVLAITRLGP